MLAFLAVELDEVFAMNDVSHERGCPGNVIGAPGSERMPGKPGRFKTRSAEG